jgi:hypothetical protein
MKYMALAAVVAMVLGSTAAAQSVGSVRIPQQVMADGQTLAPGTYQVRIAGDSIEFVQGGAVKARVLAIVPPDTMKIPPGTVAQRVRNDDDPWVRVSIKRGGRAYLAYLPPAR